MSLEVIKWVIILASIVAVVCFCALLMLEQIASNLYTEYKRRKQYARQVRAIQEPRDTRSVVHQKKGVKFEVFDGGGGKK